jgi:hypothetical protein
MMPWIDSFARGAQGLDVGWSFCDDFFFTEKPNQKAGDLPGDYFT